MSFLTQNQLSQLYSSGLSMMDIAKKYEVSLHKIVYWMNKYNIKSRPRSEAAYIRKQKTGTYKNKSKYGTITVVFDNKKLLHQIQKWCDILLNKYAEVAQW